MKKLNEAYGFGTDELKTALKKELDIDSKVLLDNADKEYVFFKLDGIEYRIYPHLYPYHYYNLAWGFNPPRTVYSTRAVIECVKEELEIVSDEDYEALINALDKELDDEIESEIEYQMEQDSFADDDAILGYAMEAVFSRLPIKTQRELVSNLDNISYTDMINLLEREDLERYIDKVRTIKKQVSNYKTESHSDLKKLLESAGFKVKEFSKNQYGEIYAIVDMRDTIGYNPVVFDEDHGYPVNFEYRGQDTPDFEKTYKNIDGVIALLNDLKNNFNRVTIKSGNYSKDASELSIEDLETAYDKGDPSPVKVYDYKGNLIASSDDSVYNTAEQFYDTVMNRHTVDSYLGFKESLNEDTVKRNGKWVNVGKDGKANSGKFKTKKAADAQRRAMYANGYKGESLEECDMEPSRRRTSFSRDREGFKFDDDPVIEESAKCESKYDMTYDDDYCRCEKEIPFKPEDDVK